MRKPFFFLILLFVAAVIFFWVYFPVLSRYRELKQQQDKLAHEITDLDAKIVTLIEERRLLQEDHNYLEKVIREELGLVKPGEIIYKMITEPARPAVVPSAQTPVASKVSSPQPVTAAAVPPSPKTAHAVAPKAVPKAPLSAH